MMHSQPNGSKYNGSKMGSYIYENSYWSATHVIRPYTPDVRVVKVDYRPDMSGWMSRREGRL